MTQRFYLRFVWSASVVLLLQACGPGGGLSPSTAAYSQLHDDSGGVRDRSYAQIIEDVRAEAAKFPALTEMIDYGTSAGGRTLTVLKIQDKSVQVSGKRPAVQITDAIHGNEFLDVANRLPREFLEGASDASGFKQLLAKGGVIFVVPVYNPDGYDLRQRENQQGLDLNRDFPVQGADNQSLQAPETRAEIAFMAKQVHDNNLSLEATMEYHCCASGLVIPWNYDVNKRLVGDQLARHQAVGEKVKALFSYPYGNVRDVVNYPAGAAGGSDDYFLQTYGRRAFSFEGASNAEEHRNLAKHVEMWDFIFSQVGEGYPDGSSTSSAAGSSDLYLAVASETSAGSLSLLAAAPEAFDGIDVCLGAGPACASGGTATHVATNLVVTKNGQRLYRLNDAVTVQKGATNLVTITATHSGHSDVTSPTRTVQILPK